MSNKKIVITDNIQISKEWSDKLLRLNNISYYTDVSDDEKTIMDRIKDAEIITANYIDITPAIIDACPRLKYIIVPAVGYEWVDVEYASTKGITVVNCPTHNANAVAELAILLLFTTARRVVVAQKQLSEGRWDPKNFIGQELSGKKLGLIGHGNIGKKISTLARGVGMSTQFVDSKSSPSDIDTLMSSSDAVMICASLNKNTENLIGKRRLNLMKKNAILINVARGAIIDEAALLDILKNQKIAGAGLDVFTNEPLTGPAPLRAQEFSKLSNVVATPHIGFNTLDTQVRLGKEIYENILHCQDDNPINIVGVC